MRPTLLVLPFLLLAACQSATDTPDALAPGDTLGAAAGAAGIDALELAVADIAPLDSSGVSGTVEFRRMGDAVEVRYSLAGLEPGERGFHVHQTGDCGADSTGTPGGAAGAHFNPMASPHGGPGLAPTARHAGDFGNIAVTADGRAEGIFVDSLIAFSGPTSVLGRAVIVHGGTDDLASQPAGDAGDRLGCGIVERR